jgi:hypothetical protein
LNLKTLLFYRVIKKEWDESPEGVSRKERVPENRKAKQIKGSSIERKICLD